MSSERPTPDQLALFQRRLAMTLEELDVTRAELGRRLGGKSSQYVSQLLSGSSRPSLQRIREIEDALGLDFGHLTLTADAGDAGPAVTPTRRLTDVRSLVDSACRLRQAGRLGSALAILEDLLGSGAGLHRLGPGAREVTVEALLLRAQLRRGVGHSRQASQDADRALRLVESMSGASPRLRARALYWRTWCLYNLGSGDDLSAVSGKAFPDDLPDDLAFLPHAVRVLLERHHRDAPAQTVEGLARAIESAPYSAEKHIGLMILQMVHPRGGDYCAQLIEEARAASDPLALCDGQYHLALREAMGGAMPRAWARLREALESASSAEYHEGLQNVLDVVCQLLRPPAVDRAIDQGMEHDQLREELLPAVLDQAWEIGRDPRWLGPARAWAHLASLHCCALLGLAEPFAAEVAEGIDSAGFNQPPAVRALDALWALRSAEASGLDTEALRAAALSLIEACHGAEDPRSMGELGFVVRETLSEPSLAAGLLESCLSIRATDGWAWALLGRCRLDVADVIGAAGAARRGWELARYMDPDLCYHPAPLYRYPVPRAERRAAARSEAWRWLGEVLEEASVCPSLASSTQSEASEMLAWLSAQ
jgi:transcriptional regulator with XRE-family HTH domain